MSATTVQWKDKKQHWSADQLILSHRSIFRESVPIRRLFFAAHLRDPSARGTAP